jgi:hypothetical protein
MLRYDSRGDIIGRIALVSTARQNGKSVIVRAIFGWLLDEGRLLPPFKEWTTLLAAAHDAKQARIIYRGVLADMLQVEHLTEHMKGRNAPIRMTEYFGITVHGLTLDTVTGQPGSARGLSAGAIAYDEVLTQRDWDMWEAISPTQSAQRSPIIILTSTAGNLESVVLRAFYDRLRRQAVGEDAPDASFYGAWWQSESPDAGLDWEQLAQANPSLDDGRLSRAAITAEHAILPPDSWRRERLNHWVDTVADLAISPAQWASCQLPEPLALSAPPYALGIDVAPGWDRATICAAAIRPDGRVGVEVYRDIREDVTVERLLAEVNAFPEPVRVIAYPSVSGAASGFQRDGTLNARPWDELTPGMVVSACMDVSEMIGAGRLAVGDPLIDAQARTVAKRDIGQDGAFRFSRRHSSGPIDAFMAMTFAAHAAAYQPKSTGFHF